MAESEEDLKSFLMKVKEENKKADLELSIKKSKIMASSPITAWQREGKNFEVMTDFTFWAPKLLWTATATMKLKEACFLEGRL